MAVSRRPCPLYARCRQRARDKRIPAPSYFFYTRAACSSSASKLTPVIISSFSICHGLRQPQLQTDRSTLPAPSIFPHSSRFLATAIANGPFDATCYTSHSSRFLTAATANGPFDATYYSRACILFSITLSPATPPQRRSYMGSCRVSCNCRDNPPSLIFLSSTDQNTYMYIFFSYDFIGPTPSAALHAHRCLSPTHIRGLDFVSPSIIRHLFPHATCRTGTCAECEVKIRLIVFDPQVFHQRELSDVRSGIPYLLAPGSV